MTFLAAIAAGGDAAASLRSWCETRVAIGQIRLVHDRDLAVAWATGCPWIDSHDDGTVLVVLDGHLHNLSSSSQSQAELLSERYRELGSGIAAGLLGDFVLIVLDRNTNTLLVARDAVGVRPWYRATAGRRHAGASDIASLTALPWVDTTVNELAAIKHLAAGFESSGETLYRGIHTLRPGETWQTRNGDATTFRHHRWDVRPAAHISWDEAAERCREVFDEAVRCRLTAGGTATSELSGGLDSSAVVGTLALLGCDDIVAGRLVFEGAADERFYSDAVIDHWRARAVSAPPWIPSSEQRAEMTRRWQRPVPDPNFTMFSGLYRDLLAAGRAEGLTGLGGDDAFAAGRIGSRVISAVQLRNGPVLKGLLGDALLHPRLGWTGIVRPAIRHLNPWRGSRVPRWLTSAATERASLIRMSRWSFERLTGVDAIDERLGNVTAGYDAWILEWRALVTDDVGRRDSHPFLDPRFIEATYGLDPWWPTHDGHSRALEVAAFHDRLPAVVATRSSKAEFSEIFWPQLLDDDAVASVRSGPLRQLGWLDPAGFDGLITDARQARPNAAIPLSRCVTLDSWLRMR